MEQNIKIDTYYNEANIDIRHPFAIQVRIGDKIFLFQATSKEIAECNFGVKLALFKVKKWKNGCF